MGIERDVCHERMVEGDYCEGDLVEVWPNGGTMALALDTMLDVARTGAQTAIVALTTLESGWIALSCSALSLLTETVQLSLKAGRGQITWAQMGSQIYRRVKETSVSILGGLAGCTALSAALAAAGIPLGGWVVAAPAAGFTVGAY